MTDLDKLKEDRENLKYILRNDALGENARAIYLWLLADIEQRIREAESNLTSSGAPTPDAQADP